MDLPFLSLDTAAEQMNNLPEANATTLSPADAPADGFKKVIDKLLNDDADPEIKLDLNLNPNMPADVKALTELKVKTDAEIDDKLQIDPAQQSQVVQGADPTQDSNMDLSVLIAQMNMAQNLEQNQPVQQPDMQTTPEVVNPDIRATNANLMPQTPDQKSNISNLKSITDRNVTKQFQLNTVAQKTDTQTTPDELDDNAAELQGMSMNIADLKIMDQPQKTEKKIKMPETAPDIAKLSMQDNNMQPVTQDANPVNAIMSKAPQHAKIEDTGATTSASTSIDNTDQSKYLNMFTQLGNFINSHTQDLKPENNFSNALNLAQQQAAIDSTRQNDQKLEIELMPKSAVLSPGALENEVYNAKIKIYPPELGHVTAELSLDKNSAQLNIVAQSQHVKEIIEANLPQLKERLQSADINLTNVQVQTSAQFTAREQNQQNSADKQGFQQQEGKPDLHNQTGAAMTQNKVTRRINSLVDTYV